MAGYDFDTYDGRLYRLFEGTVLEGVVTNHIDGGFSGPIMVSLTTDLYSHNHQQILLPQGTRLLGDVQSVGNAQQRKMSIALNTNSPSASSTAWKAAAVTMNGSAPTYLAGQSLGSARTSQLALIETSDAVSPDCLTAVGRYRSDRSANATANSSLLSSQFDTSDSTNSEVQQLNLLNAAEAQKMAEMQSQGTLQACLASQMTLANMERRNAHAEDLNTAVFIQQQRAANDTSAANEGSTWVSYLP